MFEETQPEADKEITFEAALERLQVLVDRLEEGDVPLEESVRAYADGMRLVRTCLSRLESAEETIRRLQETEEGFALLATDTEEDES